MNAQSIDFRWIGKYLLLGKMSINIVFTDLTEIGTGGSCAPAIEIDLTEEID